MIAEGLRNAHKIGILGSHHTAFTRRNRFTRVEAKAVHLAKATGMLAMIPSAKDTPRFHDPQMVLVEALTNSWRHICAQPEEMHWNDPTVRGVMRALI